jgi:voltage-gated potassium channel
MDNSLENRIDRDIEVQRASLLRRLEVTMERPLAFLGFVWLVLLVLEFTRGLGPLLTRTTLVIWGIFIVDFAIKLILAPKKLRFLRRNLLTAVSLAVPALRVIRILRLARALKAVRAVRGLRLLRVLASWNRGMRALTIALSRRGLGYVLMLTFLVLLSGAAGMYTFERDLEGGFEDFGTALWWTAMILATMGSGYWPQTAEGRLLCLILTIYGFSIFGYVTATIATFFITADAKQQAGLKPPERAGG